MSAYTKKLAWELENSFVADDEIRSAMARVRAVEEHGGDPEEEFGNPQEFAERFSPSRTKRRNYHWIMNAGGLLALAWLVGLLVAVRFRHVSVPKYFFLPVTVFAILAFAMAFSCCLTWLRSQRFV